MRKKRRRKKALLLFANIKNKCDLEKQELYRPEKYLWFSRYTTCGREGGLCFRQEKMVLCGKGTVSWLNERRHAEVLAIKKRILP
jgi:hypothetical protein